MMYFLIIILVYFVFNSMYIFFVLFQVKFGMEYGFDVLREGGLIKKLMGLGLDVYDYGDVGIFSYEDDYYFDLFVKNFKYVVIVLENVSCFFNECIEFLVM